MLVCLLNPQVICIGRGLKLLTSTFFGWLDDFDDFCDSASELADQSKGAPLFTVTQIRNMPKTASHYDRESDSAQLQQDGSFDAENNAEVCTQEDDWQLL